MKKLILTLLIVNLLSLKSHSQVNYHERTTTQVGPGMIYKHIIVASKLWNINVLEIDLQNPYVVMETGRANDRLLGYEQTSAMAARKSVPGHRVVGAVNGDFYGTGGIMDE